MSFHLTWAGYLFSLHSPILNINSVDRKRDMNREQVGRTRVLHNGGNWVWLGLVGSGWVWLGLVGLGWIGLKRKGGFTSCFAFSIATSIP